MASATRRRPVLGVSPRARAAASEVRVETGDGCTLITVVPLVVSDAAGTDLLPGDTGTALAVRIENLAAFPVSLSFAHRVRAALS